MFDLSKFMVGSDKESLKSLNVEQSVRPRSTSPPSKPPRIYDTPEEEEEQVYEQPVDRREQEEVYESPVWSTTEIHSLEGGAHQHPGKTIATSPSSPQFLLIYQYNTPSCLICFAHLSNAFTQGVQRKCVLSQA